MKSWLKKYWKLIFIVTIITVECVFVFVIFRETISLANYVSNMNGESGLLYSRALVVYKYTNVFFRVTHLILLLLISVTVISAFLKTKIRIFGIATILQLVICLSLWLQTIFVFASGAYFSHIDSLTIKSYTYNLAFKNNNEHGFGYYLFKRTDSNTPCKKIANIDPNSETMISEDDASLAKLVVNTSKDKLYVKLPEFTLFEYDLNTITP